MKDFISNLEDVVEYTFKATNQAQRKKLHDQLVNQHFGVVQLVLIHQHIMLLIS